MKSIWSIALITFKEGLRHRVITGVIVGALLVIVFSVFISGLFMRDTLKILLDISLSTVSLGGLLVPIFLAVNLLAGDIERKTIYTVLAKPISRTKYIYGKFLGFSLLAACIIAILTVAALIAVYISTFIYPSDFLNGFSILPIFISSFLVFCCISILNSCAIFWCSITTSSFLATLLTLSTYIIGESVEDIVHFIATKFEGVKITPAVEIATNLTLYIFPNLSSYDYKQYAAHSIPIPLHELPFLIIYSVAYSLLILIFSTLIFKRRDFS